MPILSSALDRRPHAAVAQPRRSAEAGLTLLELLVVLVILAMLVGLVAPNVLRQLGGARDSVARQSIERIASILELYKLDVGSYPSTDQGLAALNTMPAGVTNWNGPYLKGDAAPTDPWSHAYVYRNPSDRTGHDYDLCSMGSGEKRNEKNINTLFCNK